MSRLVRLRAGLVLLALFALAAPAVHAQTFQAAAAPDPKLSRRDVTEIVDQLATLLARDYVDSLRGIEAQRKLKAGLKAGDYRKFDQPRPLVAKLMADVQSVISDGHFNILYFPPAASGFQWTNAGEGGPPDEKKQIEEARGRLRSTNFGVAKAEVLEGNIGWLTITKFDAPLDLLREPLAAAFSLLRNTDALVIDLRKNPGGNIECVQLAFSYFLDEPARLASTEYWRSRNERKEFHTYADPGGPKYLGRPVYVLTSESTGSGAEMFSYQMKNYRKGALVGGVTSGAAHSFETYKIGPEHAGNVMVLLPNGRTIDALTQGDWENVGVQPDVEARADEAPTVAMKLALEALLAKAESEEAKAAYRHQLDKLAYRARHGEPDVRAFEKYVGRYGIRRVFVEDDRLKFQRDNGPLVELEPVDEDTFELNVAMTPKPRVRFEVEGGVAKAMVLRQMGGEERVEKEK
jgi:hypothetical protein